jgi:hypothetical protein
VRQMAWAFAFLVFDREAGRPRAGAFAGLAVAVLTVVSHQVMSGPWLLQAGFPAAARPPAAVTSSPTSFSTSTCRTEVSRP